MRVVTRAANIFGTIIGAALLVACTPGESVPPVTVTQISTVTVLSTVVQPADAVGSAIPPVAAEPEICAGIRAQRQVNERLSSDGYADSYGAEYDALLRASGCRP